LETITVEYPPVLSRRHTDIRIAKASLDTAGVYKDGYMKTAQCLAIARGAIAYIIAVSESGNIGPGAIERLKSDQESIKKLME
jgi:hypothetical protein